MASKIVAQKLYIGLEESDMQKSPPGSVLSFPRTHDSPLLNGRDVDDQQLIFDLIRHRVSRHRQQQNPGVSSKPMSFTTAWDSTTTARAEVTAARDATPADKKILTIFRAKRREAKNDCGQKLITQAVRAEPAKFEEGTESLPTVGDGQGCGYFQAHVSEIYDRVFNEDSSSVRLVSCMRMGIIRSGLQRARALLCKVQGTRADGCEKANAVNEKVVGVHKAESGDKVASRGDQQVASDGKVGDPERVAGKAEPREKHDRRIRAGGFDEQISALSKVVAGELYQKWDAAGQPKSGFFLCPDKCCWFMDIAPLPDGMREETFTDQEAGEGEPDEEDDSQTLRDETVHRTPRKRRRTSGDSGEEKETDRDFQETIETLGVMHENMDDE